MLGVSCDSERSSDSCISSFSRQDALLTPARKKKIAEQERDHKAKKMSDTVKAKFLEDWQENYNKKL